MDNVALEGLPDHLCREAWEATSDGLIFFDTEGHVRAFDRKFTQLTAAPAEIEAMFPPGCQPLDLLAAADPAATRHCELNLSEGRRLAVRADCVRVHEGLLVAIRLGGEPHPGADRREWLSAILDAADAVIVVLDRQGRFVRFNRAAEALSGYTAEEVVGKHTFNLLLFEEDKEPLQAAFRLFVAHPESPTRMEVRWRIRDGTARTLSWSGQVTRDGAGAVEYVIATAIDVTTVRETESALASLSCEFMEARSAERHGVSRYLHDTISQTLVVLALSLHNLQREPDRDTAADVKHTLKLVDRCCRDLRVISYALSPPLFDGADAAAAFEWYSRHMQEDAGVDVEFIAGPIPADTSQEVRAVLVAAVQAWAEKAIRHPNAGKTLIVLRGVIPTDEMSELHLEFVNSHRDNEAVQAVLASPVIRERVRTLGGHCEPMWEQGGIGVRISVSTLATGATGVRT